MKFCNRRGRPRILTNQGEVTPELKKKHQLGLTKDIIDIACEKGIIDPKQHQAALKFRWLYMLKYGFMSVRAYKFEIIGEPSLNRSDKWRLKKEREFAEAVAILKDLDAFEEICNIAIFNYVPSFMLTKARDDLKKLEYSNNYYHQQYLTIKDGLNNLAKLFGYI